MTARAFAFFLATVCGLVTCFAVFVGATQWFASIAWACLLYLIEIRDDPEEDD